MVVERGGSEVIVHIEDVGEQGLGGVLLQVHLLHLVLDQDRLPRDLRSRPGHPQKPGDPLEKYDVDLVKRRRVSVSRSVDRFLPIPASRGCRRVCDGSSAPRWS